MVHRTPLFGYAFWVLPRSEVAAPRVVLGAWDTRDKVTTVVGDYAGGGVVVLARMFREPVRNFPVAKDSRFVRVVKL